MSDSMRDAIERAMDRLAANLPPEPAKPQADAWEPPPPAPARSSHSSRRKMLSPHKGKDTLLPEHRALIGKWATVDLPDGAGTARLRIYTVTVRRDGRVRAEMRPVDGYTVYRQPHELRDVGPHE